MSDRIIEWMRTGMTPQQMSVQVVVLLAAACVMGWLVYRVVIVPVMQEAQHWYAVWRRWKRIKKSAPVGADAEQPIDG